MSLPSNGITPEIIREMMPPYHFSQDLLEATFAALPPPPPDAPAAWRQARITRLMQEISTLMPANAAQARLAARILIVRELADTLTTRAYAPELTVEQMCRVGRASAEVDRTATGLERLLARQQQKPAPFFGTVLADEVDVAAVDAAWCGDPRVNRPGAGSMQQPATLEPATGLDPVELRPGGEGGDAPGDRGDPTDAPVPLGMAGPTPGTSARGPGLPAMTRRESGDSPDVTEGKSGDRPAVTGGDNDDSSAATEGESGDSPAVTVGRRAPAVPGRDAGSTPEWTTSRLDQGSGWTLDVVRPRTDGEAGAGTAPGAAV